MPLYEYECEACGNRFEVIQKFSDPAVDVCRVCGKGPVQRLVSSPAIQFKGSGWYITDYARKGGGDSASGKGGKSGDSGSSDAKSDGAAKTDGGTKTDSSSKKESSTPASTSTTSKE